MTDGRKRDKAEVLAGNRWFNVYWRYPLHNLGTYLKLTRQPVWLFGIGIGRIGFAVILKPSVSNTLRWREQFKDDTRYDAELFP